MGAISLRNIVKRYGIGPKANQVIHGVSADIADGEFVVIVGPSGCGKSTLLNVIAGLDECDDGQIRIGPNDVTDVEASKRGIAMVFQSYALFPHLTVAENIVFGLRVRKVTDREARLKRVAELLGLEKLLARKPSQLSGGQQQRVALGRAIVAEAPVCLMDEPLSNLDAQLRGEMRREIRALQQRLGITMVYVTHDQTEAMTMADRVVLLRNGRIEQVGSPEELYAHPATEFTARFIGAPPMNVFAANGSDTLVGVRPEQMRIEVRGTGSEVRGVEAVVDSVEYLGADSLVAALPRTSNPAPRTLLVRVPGHSRARHGEQVHIAWDKQHEHHFDAQTGERRP
jgi:sn-glycerol 3-phosphate transport system ATP-binding protein